MTTRECLHEHLDGRWMSLSEYVHLTNPVVAAIMRDIRWADTCARTRRTVEVTARKHRARRRRKR